VALGPILEPLELIFIATHDAIDLGQRASWLLRSSCTWSVFRVVRTDQEPMARIWAAPRPVPSREPSASPGNAGNENARPQLEGGHIKVMRGAVPKRPPVFASFQRGSDTRVSFAAAGARAYPVTLRSERRSVVEWDRLFCFGLPRRSIPHLHRRNTPGSSLRPLELSGRACR
jgi:hypothetical protein